ncbi:dynein regulatory complex protein 10 isoform X1 [Fundulus heteroclitus]|uniref:dynein regulatory complex protein 10 isoform X1 n=2 Tax=Fundulus heteroclitus TaxID=8078 RepID=UPI00165C7690|nr:dynein regulatory complex protein 10 isoform X1 [Fundulus heteroclitus]
MIWTCRISTAASLGGSLTESVPTCNSMFAEAAAAEKESPMILSRKLSPEAQRISIIVENCISQVEIAAALPSILQFHAASGVADEELSEALRSHQVLEDRLKQLERQELNADGLQEKERAKPREMVQLRASVKNSVRDVLRFFRLHPDVLEDLRGEINVEVGESERTLIRMLRMFHSYLIKRLCSEKDQAPQRQRPLCLDNSLQLLISEEEKSAAALKQMNETLLEKESEIKQVERSLKELHMQIKHELSLQEKQEEVNLTSLGDELGSLKQEADQLSSQLNALMLENRKAERILQEKNDSVKIEIENILQSFDKDMLEIQAKLELTEQGYEKELEEVRKLQEPFSLLEEQYNIIQERRRLAEEKRKEEIRQLELKTKATIIIQAWWRGYSVRKALKSKAKKTKKAKKSKGKKTK